MHRVRGLRPAVGSERLSRPQAQRLERQSRRFSYFKYTWNLSGPCELLLNSLNYCECSGSIVAASLYKTTLISSTVVTDTSSCL